MNGKDQMLAELGKEWFGVCNVRQYSAGAQLHLPWCITVF
jgi:hypothetical protein